MTLEEELLLQEFADSPILKAVIVFLQEIHEDNKKLVLDKLRDRGEKESLYALGRADGVNIAIDRLSNIPSRKHKKGKTIDDL